MRDDPPVAPLDYARRGVARSGVVRGFSAREAAWYVAVAIPFGIFLAVIGLFAVGADDECHVTIGAASSPLGLLGNVPIALFGIPVVWTAFAVLLSASDRPGWRLAFVSVLLLHYAALAIILRNPDHFGDWHHARGATRGLVKFGFIMYGTGHLMMWLVFVVLQLLSRRPVVYDGPARP